MIGAYACRCDSGPRLPEAGDREKNEAGIVRGEPLPAEARAVHHAGAEVLDQDVRLARERAHELGAALGLQVDAHVALAGVLLNVEARQSVAHDPEQARHVSGGRLDLDDVCAEVGEQASGERPGDEARQIDDPQSFERARLGAHVGHLWTSFRDGSHG